VHVGVGVLLEQIEVGLERIVDLDSDAGFGFEEPGMVLAALIGKCDAEIIDVIERSGEGLAGSKGDVNSDL